jgi:hypothetical protein
VIGLDVDDDDDKARDVMKKIKSKKMISSNESRFFQQSFLCVGVIFSFLG